MAIFQISRQTVQPDIAHATRDPLWLVTHTCPARRADRHHRSLHCKPSLQESTLLFSGTLSPTVGQQNWLPAALKRLWSQSLPRLRPLDYCFTPAHRAKLLNSDRCPLLSDENTEVPGGGCCKLGTGANPPFRMQRKGKSQYIQPDLSQHEQQDQRDAGRRGGNGHALRTPELRRARLPEPFHP